MNPILNFFNILQKVHLLNAKFTRIIYFIFLVKYIILFEIPFHIFSIIKYVLLLFLNIIIYYFYQFILLAIQLFYFSNELQKSL